MSAADAVINPELAVIVVLPTATPVATPVPSTLATTGADENQVTAFVRSSVLPSEYVPSAVNCCCLPFGMDEVDGDTVSAINTGGFTVSPAELWTAPDVAVMFVPPRPIPTLSPLALIVATVFALDDHVTELVKSCVVPSVYLPAALNC